MYQAYNTLVRCIICLVHFIVNKKIHSNEKQWIFGIEMFYLLFFWTGVGTEASSESPFNEKEELFRVDPDKSRLSG